MSPSLIPRKGSFQVIEIRECHVSIVLKTADNDSWGQANFRGKPPD